MTVTPEQLAEYDRLTAVAEKRWDELFDIVDYKSADHQRASFALDEARDELDQFLIDMATAAIKEAKEGK